MKIGFVFDDSLDKTDGVQQYILTLGSWLTEQGHEVHYLVGQTTRQDLKHVHSLSRNVAVRFNGNRLSIPLPVPRRRIRALLRREQFDVLHVQMPYSPWLAGRIIKQAPVRTAVVGTFHIAPYSWLATFGARLLALLLHPTLSRFNTIVSVSPAAANFALQAFGLSTKVLPNVFDYQRFHRAKPLPAYAQDNTTTILFLGRLVARKGCQRLLEAIDILRRQPIEYGAFRVLICGAGSLDTNLKRYVKTHGLTDSVTFVGRISEADKPRYLASADISVFPSSGGESFGIVLVEAMASGRSAVLGGDNPGYRSVLGDRPEQLFATTTAGELADKLARLLQDSYYRHSSAAWGSKEAARYDVAVVGQQLVELYEQVAQNSLSG